MKKITLSLLLTITVLLSTGLASGDTHAGWIKFDDGIAVSEKESKPVLIDFFTSWCHWCKVMDEKTFSNDEIAKYLDEHFVTVRVNAEDKTDSNTFQGNTYTSVDLAQAFRVTGYPSLAFLDKEQQIVSVIPGFLPPEQFINILKFIKQECYKKDVSFEDFVKNGCKDTDLN